MTQVSPVGEHPGEHPGVGDVVGEKYRLVRQIGRGGMGEVYEARHLVLNERVALKTLVGELVSSGEFKIRFLREARATAKIKNEHVVSVFDVGELPGGAPYIVMEYLEGADLAERGQAPHAVADTVDYVLQACEALAEAHIKGIVHRDLKPSNLFLTKRSDGTPCVKVLDFGISKLAESDDALTRTNETMGTVRYMSPEQLRSARDVDGRTDIWSMGVVLFELLTHELPFRSEHGGSLVLAIVDSPPRPLAELRPDLPPGLVEVVMRCLEKDRERRFESMSELAMELAPFGSDEGRRSCERIVRIGGLPSARRSAAPPRPASFHPPPAITTPAWGMSGQQRPDARYGLKVLLAVGLVSAVTFAIVVNLGARDGTSSRSSSPAPETPVQVTATAEPAPTRADPAPTPAATSAEPAPVVVPAPSSAPAVRGSSVPAPGPPPGPTRRQPKPKPTGTVADDRHG